jgi:Mn-dependent DtxR family transcriptional regulator
MKKSNEFTNLVIKRIESLQKNKVQATPVRIAKMMNVSVYRVNGALSVLQTNEVILGERIYNTISKKMETIINFC